MTPFLRRAAVLGSVCLALPLAAAQPANPKEESACAQVVFRDGTRSRVFEVPRKPRG